MEIGSVESDTRYCGKKLVDCASCALFCGMACSAFLHDSQVTCLYKSV
jgi:hypothetical protein